MVPIEFTYTADEIEAMHRANRSRPLKVWAWPLVIGAATLPSLILSAFGTSRWMALIFMLIEIGVIVRFARLYWRPPRVAIENDTRRRVYSAAGRHESISHSEFEINWSNFEGWSETESEFVLMRMGRQLLEPKRAMLAQQVDEIRSLLMAIGRTAPNSTPTGLYRQWLQSDNAIRRYQFEYREQDCRDAIHGTAFSVPDQNVDQVTGPPSNWQWPLTLIALLGILAAAIAWVDRGTTFLAVAWNFGLMLLPCGIVWLAVKWLKWRAMSHLPAIPSGPTELAILSRGMVVGQPGACSVYDWRDVDAFYQNRRAILVQCLGQQVFLPKRLFSDEAGARDFLVAAIQLRQQAKKTVAKTGPAVSAVETGNPYQAPSSPD